VPGAQTGLTDRPGWAARLAPVALAAAAGVSVWLSLGVLAVTDASTRARIGALPPLWVLAAIPGLAASAAVAGRLSLPRAWPLALALLLWLPWLPGRIPAAFLIWQGPMLWLVWAAVALGLVFGGAGPRAGWGLLAEPRRAPWIAGVIAAAGALAAAIVLDQRIPTGDEPHYLIITQSLLADGDLQIENNHRQGDYLAYFPSALQPDFMQRGSNGAIYSIHAPGVSAVVLPAFAAAGYPGALATMILLWAAATALVWHTAWRLTGESPPQTGPFKPSRAGAAWTTWAAVALSTPGFFHSFTIYPDTAGALCVAAGMWLLVELEKHRCPARAAVVACGAVFAMLPWLHTRFALLAAVFGAASALRLRSLPDAARNLTALFALPLVSAVLWFGFFWWIWGTPNPAAPYGRDPQNALRQMWPGVPGLLADQQFGLVSNAPVYAIAAAGIVALLRPHPRLAVEIALLAVPYVFAVGAYRMWWGGLSAPGRLLAAVLPAAALPVAWIWAHGNRAWRSTTLGLLLIGGAMTAARLSVERGVLLFNARDGFDVLLDRLNRSVSLPLAAPSLHRDVVPDALIDIATWIAGSAIVLGLAGWLVQRRGAGRATAWAAMGGAAATAIMISATIVWARHGGATVTPGTSGLAWLQQWSPSWQTVGLQLRPFRVSMARDLPARLELGSADRGPVPIGAAPLFSAPFVPAGDYDVVLEGSRRPAGRLTVIVGRVQQALDEWDLDGRPTGLSGLVLHLPVLAHSVTIQGDETARAAVSRVVLRPRSIRAPDARLTSDYARRASRYNRARVFFLDDDAFMEPPGFWTRGGADTTLVVDADAEASSAGFGLRVRAGAVATSLAISSGAWSASLTLAANETREVALPPLGPGRDAWVVTLVSGPGFRPGQHDPANPDLRNLGVWVEF
jgi:hypothetical protein